jgi:transposase-like protein
VGERSQLQYSQRGDTSRAERDSTRVDRESAFSADARAEAESDADELAAWGDGEVVSSAPLAPGLSAGAEPPAPAQTPLVARFDLGGADSNLRGTGGAAVLDDEQQATLVRSLLLGELSTEEACAAHRVTREQLTQWVRRHRRSVRRSIEEQIGTALNAQGLDKEDFVLSGNLESMSLSDLLETIQLGRKNAHVRVESGTEVGELWANDGDVIDARVGKLVGSPAVYRLLELTDGKLQAEFCSTERERTILASTETLLIEYARRADERKMLRDQIGDLQRVYVACVGAALAASLEPRRRELLQAFDGLRTVENVLAGSDRPELETLTVIADLLAQKQLVPLAAAPAAPRISDPPVVNRAAQPGYASLFPSNAGPATMPSASLPEPSIAAPPSSQVVSSRALSARGGASLTVPPIVPSVALLQSMPALARRTAPFVLGAGGLVFAFAVGLWSARSPAPVQQTVEPAARSAEASVTEALCGPGMELFAPRGGERPFCLARRSVSTAEYQACVDGKHCEPTQVDSVPAPGETDDGKARCNAGQPGRDGLPVNCVTQRQAEQYCEWRGQRLPLPVEWEQAWQATRSTPEHASMSFEAAGLDSPLGELSEWTKERTAQPRPSPTAAAPAAAPAEPTTEAQPSAQAQPEAAPATGDHVEAIPQGEAAQQAAAQQAPAQGAAAPQAIPREPATREPAQQEREAVAQEPLPQSFAVMRAPPPGVAKQDARPKRLYTSATAQGRGIGFRCAVSLETTR